MDFLDTSSHVSYVFVHLERKWYCGVTEFSFEYVKEVPMVSVVLLNGDNGNYRLDEIISSNFSVAENMDRLFVGDVLCMRTGDVYVSVTFLRNEGNGFAKVQASPCGHTFTVATSDLFLGDGIGAMKKV